MQKTRLKSVLLWLVCVALMAAMALTTTGCNNNTTASTIDRTFTLSITDAGGKETITTVTSDKPTVGEALTALGILEGEDGPYGLYIKSINGITADYDKDKTYWAFYVDGQYAVTGADMTPIVDGATYGFKIER